MDHELVLCNRLLCSDCCAVTGVAKLRERKQTSLQADLNIKQWKCFTNLKATFPVMYQIWKSSIDVDLSKFSCGQDHKIQRYLKN